MTKFYLLCILITFSTESLKAQEIPSTNNEAFASERDPASSRRTKKRSQDDTFIEEGVDSGTIEIIEEEVSPRRKKRRIRRRYVGAGLGELTNMVNDGKNEEASERLYELSRSTSFRSERVRAKYLLGLALRNLGFNQAASYQFVSVIKDGRTRYVAPSLERLTEVADILGDEATIFYAVSRIKNEDRAPRALRDVLALRKGELFMKKKKYLQAARKFSRIRSQSSVYPLAKYKEGLAYAKAKKESKALRAIRKLLAETSDLDKTHPTRVTAQLAKARVLYQKKDWDAAAEAYRVIPRDSIFWHETLFEQSWAYMRGAKFRSALSNFHSLHSPYYEKFYIPESLILRAIVYLYICNYGEMEKVIQLFDRVYTPVQEQLGDYMRRKRPSVEYFEDFDVFVQNWQTVEHVKKDESKKYKGPIPEVVARHFMKDGELRQHYNYYNQLKAERVRYQSMSENWQASRLGAYVERALNRRIKVVRKKIGQRLRTLLVRLRRGLDEYVEQNSFLRLEIINSQKEAIKKGKPITPKRVDEDEERDFYIQNGYEYWPFKGEYWLDEIGNYHFLGTRSCG